jgi:protein-S-isoprenylcysteine O-methyltransferase Ste14
MRVWAARWRVPLGFAFAVAYLFLSSPTPRLLIAGSIVAFAGLALRAWASGHIQKGQKLATGGPYSYTRNPLYLGSLLLGVGFLIAGRSWIMAAAFCALFSVIYIPVMRHEEEFLRQRFEFGEYARAVPLFFPWPGRRGRGHGTFSWQAYRRNREYNAATGYAALLVFLIVKLMLR